MYGYCVLKEGYIFHHACNFFSSFSKSYLNARHLNWIHCENPRGSFLFFKNSYVNLGHKRVTN